MPDDAYIYAFGYNPQGVRSLRSQPGPSPTISTAKPPEIKNWNNQTWLLEQLLLDRPRSPFSKWPKNSPMA